MENKFKINFRQQKYMLPLITYPFVIGTLYLFCDMFNTELAEKPTNMKSTEYLNSDLPEANVSDKLGNKTSNMRDTYGNISDFTAVGNIGEDTIKNETYESKYSDEEARRVQEEELKRQAEKEALLKKNELEKRKAEKEQERRSNLADKSFGSIFDNDAILSQLSPEDRKRLEELRNNRRGRASSSANNPATQQGPQNGLQANAQADYQGGGQSRTSSSTNRNVQRNKEVKELSEDTRAKTVTKVNTSESSYFNTISSNQKESNLIKAIIDENVKAVDGSRVRLRLLDDIEIEGTPLPKGTYLYATMSGFSSQRATGKIESVLVDDELIKISLSIYDLDGIEGLYIPESKFRETAKDVVGSATEQSMQFNNTGTGSMAQWVSQATQNAYQKASQAIGKAIKKKSVRLKYGTHVYLINGKPKSKKEK